MDGSATKRSYYIGTEADLITDSQGRKCVRAYVYYNSISNRVAVLDRVVTAADIGVTPEAHSNSYSLYCSAVETGSTGVKTVRFTIQYSASQSVPFSSGSRYTFWR